MLHKGLSPEVYKHFVIENITVEKMEIPWPGSHLTLVSLPTGHVQYSQAQDYTRVGSELSLTHIKSSAQGGPARWRSGPEAETDLPMKTCPEADGILALDLPP